MVLGLLAPEGEPLSPGSLTGVDVSDETGVLSIDEWPATEGNNLEIILGSSGGLLYTSD